MARLKKKGVVSELIAVGGKSHFVTYPCTVDDPGLIAALVKSGARVMPEPRSFRAPSPSALKTERQVNPNVST
jgi:hypothetical protein